MECKPICRFAATFPQPRNKQFAVLRAEAEGALAVRSTAAGTSARPPTGEGCNPWHRHPRQGPQQTISSRASSSGRLKTLAPAGALPEPWLERGGFGGVPTSDVADAPRSGSWCPDDPPWDTSWHPVRCPRDDWAPHHGARHLDAVSKRCVLGKGRCLRKLQRDPQAKDVTKVSISGEQRNGVAESVGRNQQIH